MSMFHKTIGDVLKTFTKARDDLLAISGREQATVEDARRKMAEYRIEAERAQMTAEEAARIAAKIEALIS